MIIDVLKYATISQIYIRDLKYYDAANHAECLSFCTDLGISSIPDRSHRYFYEIEGNDFVKRELDENNSCSPKDFLFDTATLQKFKNRRDNVLFVVENSQIKGVVHIVDYNCEFLMFGFYKLIYYFERNLREFLQNKCETNESVKKWAQKNESYKKQIPKAHKIKSFAPFQAFYLLLLLKFVTSQEVNYFNWECQKIRLIRNWVAHNIDIIPPNKNENEGEPMYDIDGLERFIDAANDLFDYFEALESELKFQVK